MLRQHIKFCNFSSCFLSNIREVERDSHRASRFLLFDSQVSVLEFGIRKTETKRKQGRYPKMVVAAVANIDPLRISHSDAVIGRRIKIICRIVLFSSFECNRKLCGGIDVTEQNVGQSVYPFLAGIPRMQKR